MRYLFLNTVIVATSTPRKEREQSHPVRSDSEIMRSLVLAILLGFCVGCHPSGTWNDSPDNWDRAFGQNPPSNLRIARSYYWRSPHFTPKFEYFFQIDPGGKLRNEFNAAGQLQRCTPDTNHHGGAIKRRFQTTPEWFTPKPLDHYEIWSSKQPDRQSANFRLFIDQETGTMFMTDSSI